MKLRYWLSSKRLLIAQLQEARDDVEFLNKEYHILHETTTSYLSQLHRVARERDKERELRLAAEELSKHPLYKEE